MLRIYRYSNWTWKRQNTIGKKNQWMMGNTNIPSEWLLNSENNKGYNAYKYELSFENQQMGWAIGNWNNYYILSTNQMVIQRITSWQDLQVCNEIKSSSFLLHIEQLRLRGCAWFIQFFLQLFLKGWITAKIFQIEKIGVFCR